MNIHHGHACRMKSHSSLLVRPSPDRGVGFYKIEIDYLASFIFTALRIVSRM